MDTIVQISERLHHRNLQELLWAPEDQAAHRDRAAHLDLEDQMVQGIQCRPSHPSRRLQRWLHLGLPSLLGILEDLENRGDPVEHKTMVSKTYLHYI